MVALLLRITLVATLCVIGAGAVMAQPLGTFRWQQRPYCNMLTLTVVQDGGLYHLDGVDDQCGAATSAAAVGLAFPNPDGTIGLGVTVVTTPGGTALHLDATVTLPSVSGTWRDSAGNSGPFVLTPGATAPGAPRPVPRVAFPAGISAGGTTITNVAPPVAGSDAATKGYVDTTVAAKANAADVRQALLGQKVWKAFVNKTGAPITTGPYTSSRPLPGYLYIVFDVTGLGLSPAFPIVVATGASTDMGGITFAVVNSLSYFFSGEFMTAFAVLIRTVDASGALVDGATVVWATLPDADTGSQVPPLTSATLPPGASCEALGEVTRCVYRPDE